MGDEYGNGPLPFRVAEEAEKPKNTDTPPISFSDVMGTPGKAPGAPAETPPAVDRTSAPSEVVLEAPVEKAPPVDTKPIEEVRKVIQQISRRREQLLSLYVQNPDGSLRGLRAGKVPDGAGGEIDVREAHDYLVGEMCRDYEQVVKIAERGAVPHLDAAILGLKRESDQLQAKMKTVEEDLIKRGLSPRKEDGTLSLEAVDALLKRDPAVNEQDRAKLVELKELMKRSDELSKQRIEYKLLRDAPSIAHAEYSKYLQTIGLPGAARVHHEKALAWSDAAKRSEELRRVGDEIKKEQDARVSVAVAEKYLKSPNNPFDDIQQAREKVKAGDHNGARVLLERAREKAAKFNPEEVEQDMKKLAEDGRKELEAKSKELEAKKAAGTLTPADVLNLMERERQLNYDLKVLESFALAKPKADIAYASYLVNEDPNKHSEANRRKAFEILVDVRMDKYGKIAAAQEGDGFDQVLEKTMVGPQNNQAKLEAYSQCMAKYEALTREAASLDDNDAIAAKLKEAKVHAEAARRIASGIDRELANRNQQVIRTELSQKIAEERAKPAGQRDDGKIRLLAEIAKPAAQQNRELIDLLNESFKQAKDQDKAKIARLEAMVKNKEDLEDIKAAHAAITRMEFMKQAVNQARMAAMQIDMAFDNAEDHPYTKEIENDRFGADFTASIGSETWAQIKEATRDLAWYESAWKWLKGSIKDIAIAIAAGVSGLVVGTLVGGLSCWSGPGAVIAGGAAGFATGAAVGTGLHALCGDKITVTGVVMNGIDGMSGGLMGAGRTVARRGGAVALESLTGRAVASQGVRLTAGETFAAFRAAGMADKLRIAAGTRFGATMTGSTLSSAGYRFGHEGINYYHGKHDSFTDYLGASFRGVVNDLPANALGAGLGMGFERFGAWRQGVPVGPPSRFGFNEFLFSGTPNMQLRQGYFRPPVAPEAPKEPAKK